MAKIADSIEETPESYTTESAAAPAESAPRPVLSVPGAAVGRRKQAIARVRLIPGSGVITVNGREFEDYFPNKLHQQLITDPFTLLDLINDSRDCRNMTAKLTNQITTSNPRRQPYDRIVISSRKLQGHIDQVLTVAFKVKLVRNRHRSPNLSNLIKVVVINR